MNLLRVSAGAGTAMLCAAVFALYGGHLVRASDHQDSPTVVARPAADITDVFAYPAPDDPSNNSVVLAMDVYPLIPAGMSTQSTYAFDPSVLYQFKIASNLASGDSTEKRVIQFTVSGTGQSQTLTMYGPTNPNEASTKNTLAGAATGTIPFGQATTLPNGIKVFAGPRRDPFFFDLAQFFKIVPDRNYQYHQNGMTVPAPTATSFNGFAANANGCNTTPSSNILASYNVLQIAVEVPKSALVPTGAALGKVGIWATTATQSGS